MALPLSLINFWILASGYSPNWAVTAGSDCCPMASSCPFETSITSFLPVTGLVEQAEASSRVAGSSNRFFMGGAESGYRFQRRPGA